MLHACVFVFNLVLIKFNYLQPRTGLGEVING